MSMYKSHVVTGRIIEIQEDRILTQQGDAVCTFHSRYYILPPVESVRENERDFIEAPLTAGLEEQRNEVPKWSWIPARPWFTLQKKSANRI
jgi:hypothetical protein